MTGDCHHEEVIKLAFVRKEYPSVHPPCTEVWIVRCMSCAKEFEERFMGD